MSAHRVRAAEGLNLRSGPGTSGTSVLRTLPLGAGVRRLDDAAIAGFWHVEAEIDGATFPGWVSATGLEPAPDAAVAIAPPPAAAEPIATFQWTLQGSSTPREGRFVRENGASELRFTGIDGAERRVPVDLDYAPPSLAALPDGLAPTGSTTELGWAARALLGWMLGSGKPIGTVVPFAIGAERFAGRLEVHANAPRGVTVYRRT